MAKKPASFEYNGTLVKVLDGDTIDCYIDLGFDLKIKKRIRYMGIDTWESRTRDLDEKKKGLEAKEYTKEMLSKNDKEFTIQSHGVGKYGRVLGEIFIEGEDKSLNELLKDNGHAYEYHGGKKKNFKNKQEK